MASLLGEVDLLGLDAFGNNPGVDALYGTMIGGGISAIAEKIAVKSGKDGNFWGFAAGTASAAALYFHWKTRHAALGALAGAFFASGFDWLLGKLFGSTPTGLPTIERLNGLGLPQVEYLNGGLGATGIFDVPPSYGTIPGVYGPSGIAGTQFGQAPPIDLLGEQSPQAQQLQLMGGPTVSGLANAYGATLLGGGQ